MADAPGTGFSPPSLLALGHDLDPLHGGSPPVICSFLGFSSDIPQSLNLWFPGSPMELILCVLEFSTVQEPLSGLQLGVWLHELLQGGVFLELVGPVLPIMEVGPGSGH